MRCVQSYIVHPGPFVVTMPKGALLLGVHTAAMGQPVSPWGFSSVPLLDAVVDTGAPQVQRRLITVTRDNELPDEFGHFAYVGAFMLAGFTGFVFDAGEDEKKPE